MHIYVAAKVYLRRLSVTCSSLLSDINCVRAGKQFAMLVETYLRWSQQWPNTKLWAIDKEATKIICEKGGKHLLGSTLVTHLAQERREWVALRWAQIQVNGDQGSNEALSEHGPLYMGRATVWREDGTDIAAEGSAQLRGETKSSLSLEYPE